MSHIERLRIERVREWARGKALLLAAYTFSASAGVAALAVPSPSLNDMAGTALTMSWGALSLIASLTAITSAVGAALVLRGRGGRASRFLVRLEVPALRALAVANALYALSVAILMTQNDAPGLMAQMLTAALPAWLYWQEMRRLRSVLIDWTPGGGTAEVTRGV